MEVVEEKILLTADCATPVIINFYKCEVNNPKCGT